MLSLNGGGKPSMAIPSMPRPAGTSVGSTAQTARGGASPGYQAGGGFGWKQEAIDTDSLRRVGLFFALLFLFARFSYLPEAFVYRTGVPLMMNYWTGIPAFIALLLSGGIQRSVKHAGAVLVFLLIGCIAASVPTSHWPGGSFGVLTSYIKNELPLMLLLGGLAVNWDDVKRIFRMIAWSGLVVLLIVRFLGAEKNGRQALEFAGSIGDPNDLASHLLLVLPFFLYVVSDRTRWFGVRVLFMAAIPYALYVVLSTASRGALVALGVGFLFAMIYASMTQRILAAALLVFLVFGVAGMLGQKALSRFETLFGGEDVEATESRASRRYLFEQSILFTLQYPLTGVGAGQFANFEGHMRTQQGERGNWHATHCSWTQISSELGIPALLFYCGAIFLTFRKGLKLHRQARWMNWVDGRNASFCFVLSMVMFFVTITFLSNAYSYRQLSIIAIGYVMTMALERVVQWQNAAAAQGKPEHAIG